MDAAFFQGIPQVPMAALLLHHGLYTQAHIQTRTSTWFVPCKLYRFYDTKSAGSKASGAFHSEPEGIRTPDLLVRSQTLYPAELRTHFPCMDYHSLYAGKCQYPFLLLSKMFVMPAAKEA
jgi:hypothetical protein